MAYATWVSKYDIGNHVFTLQTIPVHQKDIGRSPKHRFFFYRGSIFLQVKTSVCGSEKLKTLQKRPEMWLFGVQGKSDTWANPESCVWHLYVFVPF